MNKTKNLVIATVLLTVGTIFNQEENSQDIIIGTISPETPQENIIDKEQDNLEEQITTEPTSATPEQEAIKTWNAHLESLKVQDQHWNKNSNTPTNDWKEEAIALAKKALDQDKNIAETLKSAFFNAITEKIKIEEDEFTASTYALIKEFDDAIDAYVKTLTETATAEETEKEEITQEPAVETVSTPIEIEAAPVQPIEEPQTMQPETPAAGAPATPKTTSEEWQDQLEKIMTEVILSDVLFDKVYELAKELLSQGYTGESLFSGFEYALIQHNANPKLFPTKIHEKIETFSRTTGIALPHNQQIQTQQEYNAAMKKQAEQQKIAKKQKETELKTAATVQEAIKKANISESQMQQLNKKLEEKLALEEAMRKAEQAKMNAELERMKRELAAAHKTKTKETPEEQGLISRAVGAVKGAASAATAWWYGESQEQKDIEKLDQERFTKLQEILKTMPLTLHEKNEIEKHWTTFITHLRTFKDLDIHNVKEIATWLNNVQQSLEFLIFTHNIIPSIKDAITIMKNAIEQYSDGNKFINSIESRLTRKQNEILAAKQQKENAQTRKLREREQRKQELERKQQKLKDENDRIKAEQAIIDAYENEKIEWQQFLARIAQHKTATEQDNVNYTHQATEKAKSLLNPIYPVVLKNKHVLEQKLKEQFTLALLQQQGNEHKVNIHKNMDQFNAAVDKITR